MTSKSAIWASKAQLRFCHIGTSEGQPGVLSVLLYRRISLNGSEISSMAFGSAVQVSNLIDNVVSHCDVGPDRSSAGQLHQQMLSEMDLMRL